MNIKILEVQLSKAEILLATKLALVENKEDFAISLSIDSLKAHISDLQFQLKVAKEEREKEVIELRLIGRDVNDGSVPLDILANLAKSFSGLVSSASARIKLGEDVSGSIPYEITHGLNLRFAGIGQGSSRLYITGDTSPDLFGESLIESMLSGLFDLLNKDLNKGLSDQVHYLGLRSTHNLAEFLRVLRKKNIEIDISWKAGNQKSFHWHGRRDKIQTLETLLDGFKASEPKNKVLNGVIELISRSGKLEIKTENNEMIKVTYSKKLFTEVRELRLGDCVSLKTNEVTVYNQATQEQKLKYSLVEILSNE